MEAAEVGWKLPADRNATDGITWSVGLSWGAKGGAAVRSSPMYIINLILVFHLLAVCSPCLLALPSIPGPARLHLTPVPRAPHLYSTPETTWTIPVHLHHLCISLRKIPRPTTAPCFCLTDARADPAACQPPWGPPRDVSPLNTRR